MAKLSKEVRARMSVAQKTRYAKARFAREREKLDEAKPLDAHYVGETTQPVVDVRSIEERAFRRGMFTALQMTIDALVRELR